MIGVGSILVVCVLASIGFCIYCIVGVVMRVKYGPYRVRIAVSTAVEHLKQTESEIESLEVSESEDEQRPSLLDDADEDVGRGRSLLRNLLRTSDVDKSGDALIDLDPDDG